MIRKLVAVRFQGLLASITAQTQQKGKKSGKGMRILFAIVILYAGMTLAASMCVNFYQLAPIYHEAGMDWMYFSIAVIMALVLSLFGALVACTQVTRISIDNPSEIKLEKADGGLALVLTDGKTVERITGLVEQLPLQSAEDAGEDWTYRITWLDADGKRITRIELAGSQIRWEGSSYKFGIGVDLSVLTDALETIPGIKK